MATSNPLFAVHKLNESGMEKAKNMAASFENLHTILAPMCSFSGREWALVKTKLEEASFFAKKAMAQDPVNQDLA